MHTNAKVEQAGLPAFSINVPDAASHDAAFIARHTFDHQPE
jgi:hypothetical protein